MPSNRLQGLEGARGRLGEEHGMVGCNGLPPWMKTDPWAPCSESEDVEEWRERWWGENVSKGDRGEGDLTLAPWEFGGAPRPLRVKDEEGDKEKEAEGSGGCICVCTLFGEVGLCTVLWGMFGEAVDEGSTAVSRNQACSPLAFGVSLKANPVLEAVKLGRG